MRSRDTTEELSKLWRHNVTVYLSKNQKKNLQSLDAKLRQVWFRRNFFFRQKTCTQMSWGRFHFSFLFKVAIKVRIFILFYEQDICLRDPARNSQIFFYVEKFNSSEIN